MRCCCWSTGSRLLTAPYACWRHLRFGVAGELVHNPNVRLGAVGLEETANAWFCEAGTAAHSSSPLPGGTECSCSCGGQASKWFNFVGREGVESSY